MSDFCALGRSYNKTVPYAVELRTFGGNCQGPPDSEATSFPPENRDAAFELPVLTNPLKFT